MEPIARDVYVLIYTITEYIKILSILNVELRLLLLSPVITEPIFPPFLPLNGAGLKMFCGFSC